MTDQSFLNLLRLSAELVQESAVLRKRARECISSTDLIISSSRKLLSQWPVSGMPSFRVPQPDVEASDTLPPPSKTPGDVTHRQASLDGPALERVEEQSFTDLTVHLDGRHFVDCRLQNCLLEYSGGPVILEGTQFSGCRFHFLGEAAMTLSMLECFGLYDGNQTPQAATGSLPKAGFGRVN